MNLKLLFFFVAVFTLVLGARAQEREYSFEKDTVKFTRDKLPADYKVDTRIDNMGYWRLMVEAGLVTVAPDAPVPAPVYKSSKIMGARAVYEDSPDIPVTESSTTQSENSIAIAVTGTPWLLNSNNSTPHPSTGSIYGADAFYSDDEGASWAGQYQGAGGGNSGDPAAVINRNGRWFVGFIANSGGQSVAFSDNQGTSWTVKSVASGSAGFLDKNHLWVDRGETSPYEGYLYDAWMGTSGEIRISRSTDDGLTWSGGTNISSGTSAGSHNQGVNIKSGPNGEVYAAWAVYDSWPSDEKAIGFARSLDGGATWEPGFRALNNIRGIRNHETDQNMRTNSFPSMTVDLSDGPNKGTIYVVWANVNTPGVNTGTGIEVYMIKSTDKGTTWSTPVKVNTDPQSNKQHFFPWIACDAANGNLAVVFYDNRNVNANQAEAWTAVSTDGGATWVDFRVSDVAFTPQPIPNMASSYFGDYLAIDMHDEMVYPCWTDNRSGHALTYVSPFFLPGGVSGPFVSYKSHILSDINPGNNNGQPDYGESIFLSLTMENIGSDPDTNVMVTLSTTSPYITMLDSTEDYGTFASEEIKFIADGFHFMVADNVPNDYEVEFEVKAVDKNDSIFISGFKIIAHAPQLQINGLTISDPTGNNNNSLDPGETAQVTISYSNTGQFPISSAISHLTTPQTFITVSNPDVNMTDIPVGGNGSATFNVTVASVPFGSAVLLQNMVNYNGQYSTEKSFAKSIGLIVEDWETGTFNKFSWEMPATNGFILDNVNPFEGIYSARNIVINHNDSAVLQIQYSVMFDDSISFFRKTSSELLQDKLEFYVDGMRLGQWSGNTSWKRFVYPVKAGAHTFKWIYVKNGSNSAGQDAAWIDFIVFPPEQKSMAYAGNDLTVCEDQVVHLNGSAEYYNSLLWTTSGSGNFSDPSIINPDYSPSAADIAAGAVTLTLTVNGPGYKATVSDQVVVTFNLKPTAFAGADASICAGNNYQPADASATNYQSILWTTTGTGSFDNTAIVNPVFTPGVSDVTAGFVKMILAAESGNTCGTVKDTVNLAINPLPTVQLSGLQSVCAGDSVKLSYHFTGTAPFTVVYADESTNTFDAADADVWMHPAGNTTYAVTKVTDANGCFADATASLAVTVNPLPVLDLPSEVATCGNRSVTLDPKAQGAESYLWTPGGKTTAVIEVDSTGLGLGDHDFTLVATSAQGCKSERSITVNFFDCTGMDEEAGNVRFRIFPNPNKGEFYVSFASQQQETVKMQLVSANGATVYSDDRIVVGGSTLKKISVKKAAAGIYLLHIVNNNVEVTKEIVITK